MIFFYIVQKAKEYIKKMFQCIYILCIKILIQALDENQKTSSTYLKLFVFDKQLNYILNCLIRTIFKQHSNFKLSDQSKILTYLVEKSI